MSFEKVQSQAGGGTVGEKTDDDQGQKLRGKAGAFQKGFQKTGDQIQKAGGPEDSHCSQKANQCGQNAKRRVKTTFCSLHESLIDVPAFPESIVNYIKNKKRKNICRQKYQKVQITSPESFSLHIYLPFFN